MVWCAARFKLYGECPCRLPDRFAATTRGLLIVGAIIAFGAPAQAETLRVGKSTLTSFTYTLLEVGMQSGIFEKHGLTIESSAFGGGPRLIQGMTAGAIDIGLDGGTDMAHDRQGRADERHRAVVRRAGRDGHQP